MKKVFKNKKVIAAAIALIMIPFFATESGENESDPAFIETTAIYEELQVSSDDSVERRFDALVSNITVGYFDGVDLNSYWREDEEIFINAEGTSAKLTIQAFEVTISVEGENVYVNATSRGLTASCSFRLDEIDQSISTDKDGKPSGGPTYPVKVAAVREKPQQQVAVEDGKVIVIEDEFIEMDEEANTDYTQPTATPEATEKPVVVAPTPVPTETPAVDKPIEIPAEEPEFSGYAEIHVMLADGTVQSFFANSGGSGVISVMVTEVSGSTYIGTDINTNEAVSIIIDMENYHL